MKSIWELAGIAPLPQLGAAPLKTPVVKPMHPTMRRRAQLVKEAHAHLSATVPSFSKMAGPDRMRAVQTHVRLTLGGQ